MFFKAKMQKLLSGSQVRLLTLATQSLIHHNSPETNVTVINQAVVQVTTSISCRRFILHWVQNIRQISSFVDNSDIVGTKLTVYPSHSSVRAIINKGHSKIEDGKTIIGMRLLRFREQG